LKETDDLEDFQLRHGVLNVDRGRYVGSEESHLNIVPMNQLQELHQNAETKKAIVNTETVTVSLPIQESFS